MSKKNPNETESKDVTVSPEQNGTTPHCAVSETLSETPHLSVNPEQSEIKRRRTDKILNIMLIAAVALFIATFFIRGFVFSGVSIKQTSMSPTYAEGQRVWVDKTAKVKRGNVVVFYEQDVQNKFLSAFVDNEKKLIKRVIAVEGDKIWVEEERPGNYCVKVRTADGSLLSDDYYEKDGITLSMTEIYTSMLGRLYSHIGEENAYTVPAKRFFAMGDNRNNSKDSRSEEIGDIRYDRLFGTVLN